MAETWAWDGRVGRHRLRARNLAAVVAGVQASGAHRVVVSEAMIFARTGWLALDTP